MKGARRGGVLQGKYVNYVLLHNNFANLVAYFHEIEAGGYCDRGVVGVDCAYHLTVGCVNLDSGLCFAAYVDCAVGCKYCSVGSLY